VLRQLAASVPSLGFRDEEGGQRRPSGVAVGAQCLRRRKTRLASSYRLSMQQLAQ